MKKFLVTFIIVIWFIAGLILLTTKPSDASLVAMFIIAGVFFLPIIILALIVSRKR